MPFAGWPVEAVEFYEGLEADNSKAFWTEHKTIFETKVKGPMEALLTELEPEFGAGKMFRPYRDVRFSKDKTPYKTNLSAVLGSAGYISLSKDGLGVGSGMWTMEPPQLARYRKAVDAAKTGEALSAVITGLKKRGIELGGHGELKRVPPGIDKDHPRAELLRYKGLTSWQSWPVGAWLGTKKAKDRIVRFLHHAQPLNDWLAKNVGS